MDVPFLSRRRLNPKERFDALVGAKELLSSFDLAWNGSESDKALDVQAPADASGRYFGYKIFLHETLLDATMEGPPPPPGPH